LIDQHDANNESGDSEPAKGTFPITISAPQSLAPESPNQSEKQNATKNTNGTDKVMRPLIAVWRGIITLGRRTINGLAVLNNYSGAFTALATVAIAALTWVYAGYSRKQWEVAQSALQVSQRAYVTIGRKDGTIAEFISSKNPKQKAELVIYFQNSGHLPAKLAWGSFGPELNLAMTGVTKPTGIEYIHPFKFMERTRNWKTGAIGEQGVNAVIAGTSEFRGVLGEITEERLMDFLASDTDILIEGMYEYCDELGTESRHEFSIHARNAQNTAPDFSLLSDTESVFIE
jgi:hypothetical protein